MHPYLTEDKQMKIIEVLNNFKNKVHMKTYLITGGCGFIGSNFIHYLIEENLAVYYH